MNSPSCDGVQEGHIFAAVGYVFDCIWASRWIVYGEVFDSISSLIVYGHRDGFPFASRTCFSTHTQYTHYTIHNTHIFMFYFSPSISHSPSLFLTLLPSSSPI